jgi:hypothetical protein
MSASDKIGRKEWATPEIRELWVEPEFRELDVRETFAAPGRGNDVGGNPFIDCQRS